MDQDDIPGEIRKAFAHGYEALRQEVAQLRHRNERQSTLLADHLERERQQRKLLETHYQLLRARDRTEAEGRRPGPVLTLPVRKVMGLPEVNDGADAASGGVDAWVQTGGETDDLEAVDQTAAAAVQAYSRLQSPVSISYRLSPGLAAFSLKRGDLRPLGFNLIGVADDRIETLAEEIAQSVALNRKFAPLILTTTRSELQAFRRRRLTYESLPVFGPAITRLTGIASAQQFYDLRVGYVLRKWRIVAVMNMGGGYTYKGAPAGDQSSAR